MKDDGSSRMHGRDCDGITVRQHMALEITKAMIINPVLYERASENGAISLTKTAVILADKLLEHLEENP